MPRSAQMNFRVRIDLKNALDEAAARCGIDSSTACRIFVELALQRISGGGDLLDALQEMKAAWRIPRTPTAMLPRA